MSGEGDRATADAAVFVYGTLRPGRINWPVLAAACHRHEPAVLPGYALFDLDHPGIVALDDLAAAHAPDAPLDGPGWAGGGVRGDLVWLDPGDARPALDRLDRFEGYEPADPDGSYYRRVLRRVVPGHGDPRAAWVYLPGRSLLAQVRPERRVHGDDWP